MKTSNETKTQLKNSAKVLITLVAVGGTLSLGVIVAALASNHPQYDKTAHQNARQAYNRACDAYSITYNVAQSDAQSAVYMDDKNSPLLWDITATELAMEKCNDSLTYELDNRISEKMTADSGLDIATAEMANAAAVLEKYENDSTIRAEWRATPLKHRVNDGLRKIFLNKQQRIAQAKRLYNR